jgi:endonuclease-3
MSKNSVKILNILSDTYPQAHCELVHNSAWQLMVATILSAQCTDKRVNIVTRDLFKAYPNLFDYDQLDIEKLKVLIRTTGFFNNKAKYILSACKKIMKDFEGKVPNSMEKLITIPGVARKTANVILSVWFGINEGIAIDTHVKRISKLLGLTNNSDVIKIEKDLMALYPAKEWEKLSTLIIWHGRNICKARNPQCEKCPLNKICPGVKIKKLK